MALSDDLSSDVQDILDIPWNQRHGNVVPTSSSVVLAGGAIELQATFLYADLANSSRLAKILDRRIAAKVMKAFLATTARLVRHNGGTIVSFDGDRILGVFIGGSKNSSAAKCALQINYAVTKVIRPRFKKKYSWSDGRALWISHGAGIDTGAVLVVRAGARGDNDLIWVGRAPNLAAKLSDVRDRPHSTFITAAVYDSLNNSSKFSSDGRKNMWDKRHRDFLGDAITVYRSSWYWPP